VELSELDDPNITTLERQLKHYIIGTLERSHVRQSLIYDDRKDLG